MPVVIGDFEVVGEPPAQPPAPATAVAAPPAPPDPVQLQRLLAELHALELRRASH
jgi:hypothetical protein